MKIEARYFSNYQLTDTQCKTRSREVSDEALFEIRQAVKAALNLQQSDTLNPSVAKKFYIMAKKSLYLANLLTADVLIEVDGHGTGRIHFEMQDLYFSAVTPASIKTIFLELAENATEVLITSFDHCISLDYAFALFSE